MRTPTPPEPHLSAANADGALMNAGPALAESVRTLGSQTRSAAASRSRLDAATTSSVRLAASHDALAHYLRGRAGAPSNGRDQDSAIAQGTHGAGGPDGADGAGRPKAAAANPASTDPPSANLVWALANDALAPLARDRPWTLVSAAAVIGALLATRRGRTVLRPLLVAGAVSPVLGGRAMRSVLKNLTNRLLGPDPHPSR